MDVYKLRSLIERLRKEAIGRPEWNESKSVYEYKEQTPRVVAVLKLVRAAHGLSALEVLCRMGLFIDAGAIMRCISDCAEEVYFLLENYPRTNDHVEQFVKRFFEATIDEDYLADQTPDVPTKKVRSAVVRVLKGRNDDATRKLMERIYRVFCGYVHANYAHVMEVYNGALDDFNLAGVPSEKQRAIKSQYVEVSSESVLHAAAFLAFTLGLKGVHEEFANALR
jgi:hypothetical protein